MDMNLLNPDANGFLWARVRAFASNAMVSRGTPLRLGSFIAGLDVAPYNGSNRAHLDAWSMTDPMEWRLAGWGTLIESHELGMLRPLKTVFTEKNSRTFRPIFGGSCSPVLGDWVSDWLPVLGEKCFAMDCQDENPIWVVRLMAPDEDPHVYMCERRGGGGE